MRLVAFKGLNPKRPLLEALPRGKCCFYFLVSVKVTCFRSFLSNFLKTSLSGFCFLFLKVRITVPELSLFIFIKVSCDINIVFSF